MNLNINVRTLKIIVPSIAIYHTMHTCIQVREIVIINNVHVATCTYVHTRSIHPVDWTHSVFLVAETKELK